MKVMVAYDGTLRSKEALTYGIEKAREKKGELVILYVFNPFPFMYYDTIPSARGIALAESERFMDEAVSILHEKGSGIKTSLIMGEGDPDEEIISYAKAEKADIVLCPPRYKTIIKKYKKILSSEVSEVSESEVFDEEQNVKLAVLSVPDRSKTV